MADRRRESADSPHKSTTEQRISRFASRQLRLITAQQLAAAGLARGSIQDRVRNGRLHRLHQGVYATHPPPYTREQRWLAAVYACGAGAALSDLCSATLQGFATAPPPPVVDVTVPSGRGRSRAGIRGHRRAPIDPRDLRRVGGVPCTSADLTLVDLAPTHTETELETLMVAAESQGLLKRHRLAELVSERRGRPGIRTLASLLALEPQLTRSDLERSFLPVRRAAGVPRPRTNYPVRVPTRFNPLLVDFAWPDLRLVVEADSQRFHGDWASAERDRERDQLLTLAGWLCHRFVRRRIRHDPEGSAMRLRLLVEARAAELG